MEKPLHIIHVIFSLRTGGAESMLVDIANGQADKGHRVEVIIINDEIEDGLLRNFSDKVRVVCMHRSPGSNKLALLLKLNAMLLKTRPDIIHGHNSNVAAAVRVLRNRLVMTVHAIGFNLNYCKKIKLIAITDAVAQDVMSRQPNAEPEVIYNGIGMSRVNKRCSDKPADRLRLVQVASLYPEKKGQDLLIEAVAILKQRGIDNITVDFIGGGRPADSLRQLAETKEVSDRVNFLGKMSRENVYAKLCEYDAMVHPSRFEGFGLTVAEAMAAGLPLIVTEKDGPWEVAGNGKYCLCGTKDDAASFADAIENLINDYDAALVRAAEAREYVKRYDISNTVDNYISYYRRMK